MANEEKKVPIPQGNDKTNEETKDAKSKKHPKHRRERSHRSGDKNARSFGPGNDVSWWTKVPELMNNASNLKSSWIAGNPLDEADIPFIPKGVVRMNYFPMYGVSSSATDPLNVWARDLYLRMFQKYRGINSYEYPDLGIAIISAIEVVRMIAKLERIYGVVTRYSKINSNMPQVEATALGLTAAQADWIRGHLSDYRFDLNELIRKAQRLCIPKDMTILQDIISLLGYEYLDHDNAKAQIIIFDSDWFGVYQDTTLASGGSIAFEPCNMSSSVRLIDITGTSDNMFAFLSRQLDALLGSTGVQKIFGDLVAWFGEDQLLTIMPLPDDFVVAPAYSESILHKMHNLETTVSTSFHPMVDTRLSTADVTALKASQSFVIYQYDNNIISRPTIDRGGPGVGWITDASYPNFEVRATNQPIPLHGLSASLIDTYRVEASEETVIEGVLFKYACNPITGTATSVGTVYAAPIHSCAFELIVDVTVYGFDMSGAVAAQGITLCSTSPGVPQSSAGSLCILDWAPLSYLISGTSFKYLEVYGDIDNPIPLSVANKTRLHKAIIYSGLKTDITPRA